MKSGRVLAQPTSFGDEPPLRSRRFYSISNYVLPLVAKWVHKINVALALCGLGLLIYTGLMVDHEETYVSDGTHFSCRVDSLINAKGSK